MNHDSNKSLMGFQSIQSVLGRDEWLQQVLGWPWALSAEERQMRALAEEYQAQTEDYDNKLCTGPIIRGSRMPATPDQRARSSAFARGLYHDLGSQAARLGFTPKQWQEAVVDAAHPSRRRR